MGWHIVGGALIAGFGALLIYVSAVHMKTDNQSTTMARVAHGVVLGLGALMVLGGIAWASVVITN